MPPALSVVVPVKDEAIYKIISDAMYDEVKDALNTQKYEKLDSYARVDAAKKKVKAMFAAAGDEKVSEAAELFDTLKERIFRDEKRNPEHSVGQCRDFGARNDRRNGSTLQGCRYKIMAVQPFSSHGEKQIARCCGPRINGIAGGRSHAWT